MLTEQLFPHPDRLYRLYAATDAGGPSLERWFHYRPSHPSRHEVHPRPLLWRNDAEKQRILAHVQGGSQVHRSAYLALRDLPFYNGHDLPMDGARGGFRSDYERADYVLHNAFVGIVETQGFRYGGGKHALRAKQHLLGLLTLPPIGHENPLWWPNPALERVMLGQEQMFFYSAAIGYDLLISGFRAEQGHPQGITPIEDLKLRDNLANLAMSIMQFRGNNSSKPGEGDVHWAAGMDMALMPIAAAMPTYSTHYYGTSGADGSAAVFPWTPYPNQAITWWDSVRNRTPRTPGHPDMDAPSRIWMVYPDSGKWSGPVAYESSFYSAAQTLANVGKLADGWLTYANLDTYLGNKVQAGLGMALVVNARFPFAKQSLQNLGTIDARSLRSVFALCYFDPSTP
jgi:hypothetical protein